MLRSVPLLLLRLSDNGSLVSLTTWLQQSTHLRIGDRNSVGRVLGCLLYYSLPAVVTSAMVHGAASSTERLRYGRVGCNDRRSSGVGGGQRRADVMMMLGGT